MRISSGNMVELLSNLQTQVPEKTVKIGVLVAQRTFPPKERALDTHPLRVCRTASISTYIDRKTALSRPTCTRDFSEIPRKYTISLAIGFLKQRGTLRCVAAPERAMGTIVLENH